MGSFLGGGRGGEEGAGQKEAGGEGQQSVWRRVAGRHQSGHHCGGTTGLRATSGSKKMLLGADNDVGGSLRVCAGLGRDSSGLWGRQKTPSRAASSSPPSASRATGGMGIIRIVTDSNFNRVRTHQSTQKFLENDPTT